MFEDLNGSPHERVSLAERQVLWWISNYPELIEQSKYKVYLSAMQVYILANIQGNQTIENIDDVTNCATDFLRYVFSQKKYSPTPTLVNRAEPPLEQVRTPD